MLLTELIKTPGEHALTIQGLVGSLEAMLVVPENLTSSTIAFLGHPHSLQGGTMNNKVVTTMARAFKEAGIPSLRFNFRGVGQSQGTYDEGIGESADMIFLVQEWQKQYPESHPVFAGFSFGSYVAYRSAVHVPAAGLITIAPPVHHYNYKELGHVPDPWLIIQGDADEVVPYSVVAEFAKEYTPPLPLIELTETGHFFHGKLLELKAHLLAFIRSEIQSS